MLDTPLERTYLYLADPRNRPGWQASLLSVKLTDRSDPHVGMEWRETTMAGVRPRMRITELDPGVAWAEEGRWAGVTGTLRLTFAEASPARTRIGVEGVLAGRGAWVGPARLAALFAGRAVAHDLRRAGRILTEPVTGQ